MISVSSIIVKTCHGWYKLPQHPGDKKINWFELIRIEILSIFYFVSAPKQGSIICNMLFTDFCKESSEISVG